MKFKDHLDFHKLPFDKEKIREQVEKIAADCMRWVTRRQNARPLLAMALCTCIAFSAMVPYIPVAAPAEISTERITEPETFDILEDPTERETEETTAEIDPDAPAPYKLNLANMYAEGSETSYAEILMKELIQKDSKWFAAIYNMANTAPVKLAPAFGRKASSVLGQYNPTSKTQNKNDPSTWYVEHFKNVKITFYNGDGEVTSAVSNAQDILSMASVYAYYNGITDLDSIRAYVNDLWTKSHSYQAVLGNVYYCDGCVDPNASAEEGDSELEGEDTFVSGRNIDTEIRTDVGDEVIDQAGDTVSVNGESYSGSSSSASSAQGASEGTTTAAETTTVPPSAANHTEGAETKESTTSALDSLAETAESVIQETKKKTTIVRVEDSTTAAETTKAPETTPQTAAPSTQAETAPQTTAPSSEAAEETTVKVIRVSDNGDSDASSDYIVHAAAETAAPAEIAASEESEDPKTDPELIPVSDEQAETAEQYTVHAAASHALICPGHVDLKITAIIRTLSESANLYSIDDAGNAVGETASVTADGTGWEGWNRRMTSFVSHINRQDWTATYGLNVVVEGTRAPLSTAEIDTYMSKLPKDLSETRKDIIRYALQSVGKVPYYWGGKASAQNYTGNNFGSVTIPDHKGRILKGLDCSGWVNWVYWSVTGTHLPYEGTEGLKTLGRQVKRRDLKPGDIVVITGSTPHVIMFLGFTSNGQIQCVHETGSANNVTIGVMNANWPYYRNLLD